MRPIHLIVLILVVGGIVAGVAVMRKKQAEGAQPAVTVSAPPADAVYLEPGTEPLDVALGGSAFEGRWVKEPGWQVNIKQITEADSGGLALRIELPSHPTMRGSSAWLVAIVPEDTDVQAGQFVMMSGRIDLVGTFNDGYSESLRVVLRDVKLKKS